MHTNIEVDEGKTRTRARNGHRKLQILKRTDLDGRTTAAKQFDAVVHGIANDLGGESELSTVQKHLVEAFAGISLIVGDTNARLLLGEVIDVLQHATAVSTMVRTAQRIGLQRVPKQVETLEEHLQTLKNKPVAVEAEL
jgi:hypothetical protein